MNNGFGTLTVSPYQMALRRFCLPIGVPLMALLMRDHRFPSSHSVWAALSIADDV